MFEKISENLFLRITKLLLSLARQIIMSYEKIIFCFISADFYQRV